jgi:shikimate 5-dehydrogenase/shikimate kinase
MAPLILLVGHRGVGKTTFLKSFLARHPDWVGFDLDEEIARRTGRSVQAWVALGEKEFRRQENSMLREIVASCESDPKPCMVALGAGFEGDIPSAAHVLWIRRVSDALGRVFLDRPRLNPRTSVFEEYHERFFERDRRFRAWNHSELTLPEGADADQLSTLLAVPAVSLSESAEVKGDLTVLPQNLRRAPEFFARCLRWNLRRFELRDDLLEPAQIDAAIRALPEEKILYSRRRAEGAIPSNEMPRNMDVDWALELGPPPEDLLLFSLSLHEGGLEDGLRILGKHAERAKILKLAVEIHDFAELKRGHDWWKVDPTRRAFLPRSPSGRWRWYRSLFGRRMPLHFFREGEGSAPDQPFLWQEFLQPDFAGRFAAVLGEPVDQSFSPMEHLSFFKQAGWPFVAIPLSESEFAEALPVLVELGLKAAAVTAPLKTAAFGAATHRSVNAIGLRAANTVFIDEKNQVYVENTDVEALKILAQETAPLSPIWLWGGGGVKSSVLAAWPDARAISARRGLDESSTLDDVSAAGKSPEMLIWATGRSREFRWPPDAAKPRLVLDLNYTADSPGLQWAAERGLSYQSGLRMFKLQAEFQRRFWREKEGL